MKLVVLLIGCCFSLYLSASPVLVGISQDVLPAKSGNTVSFERALLQSLFTELGYQPEFVPAPHARMTRMLQLRQLDIAARQGGTPQAGLFYTRPYLQFDNRVFALASFRGALNSVQDLSRYHLASFQNARQILGPEFAAVVSKAPSYREVISHAQLVDLLKKQRVELLVLDKVTFERRWRETGGQLAQVKSFGLFAKASHSFACHQAALCQALDRKLQQWQDNGALARLRQQIRQQQNSQN
ncbi:transporter substrate-binding domain-containing protein [Rheinheimera sp.]|uniref:substrate-binding periplasmic protein n=1 Tax=Rheinheimera sp. TaxID=1869214 RepID=UPI00307EFB79